MKLLLLLAFLVVNPIALASSQQLAIIHSIDDLDLPPAYNDASEICLPDDNKSLDAFTVISDSRAQDLFNKLERNPKARNRVPGGKCAIRAGYIKRYLKGVGISSGRLRINCPSKKGRLRVIDQVSGRRYTYSNFHDANILSVKGFGYKVFDVQFKDRPVTLSSYLAQIEASQKLKPLRNRSTRDRGYCYWSIR